jgi:hypothetical protein
MNHWQNEFMAERHRQQLLAEAKEIHLEKIARQGRLYRPGLFERTMFNFANWMIATGKQLRKRYEVPVQCNKSPTGSYAH